MTNAREIGTRFVEADFFLNVPFKSFQENMADCYFGVALIRESKGDLNGALDAARQSWESKETLQNGLLYVRYLEAAGQSDDAHAIIIKMARTFASPADEPPSPGPRAHPFLVRQEL